MLKKLDGPMRVILDRRRHTALEVSLEGVRQARLDEGGLEEEYLLLLRLIALPHPSQLAEMCMPSRGADMGFYGGRG